MCVCWWLCRAKVRSSRARSKFRSRILEVVDLLPLSYDDASSSLSSSMHVPDLSLSFVVGGFVCALCVRRCLFKLVWVVGIYRTLKCHQLCDVMCAGCRVM